jgi:hypothetical protein
LRYAFILTEKAVLQEIGPPFTLKSRSMRAVKKFGETSAKLKFDTFNDIVTDGGQPEDGGRDQPPPEEIEKGGKGEEGVEDRKSESKTRKKTKPPTVDGYTNGNGRRVVLVSVLSHRTDQMPQPQFEATRRISLL